MACSMAGAGARQQRQRQQLRPVAGAGWRRLSSVRHCHYGHYWHRADAGKRQLAHGAAPDWQQGTQPSRCAGQGWPSCRTSAAGPTTALDANSRGK